MEAIFDSGTTSIQSFPFRLTGQVFLHSCLHFLGLHLSSLTIAILVSFSDIAKGRRKDLVTVVELTGKRTVPRQLRKAGLINFLSQAEVQIVM